MTGLGALGSQWLRAQNTGLLLSQSKRKKYTPTCIEQELS